MKSLHKRLSWFLICFPLAMLNSLAMAQQDGPRPITPISGPTDIGERELGAPPAIQSQLSTLRQQITSEGLTFQVGYTAPMDFAVEEITGLQPPADISGLIQQRANERASASMRLLGASSPVCSPSATSFDWRQNQGATAVRDQGNCGSCWAFATHGAFEGALRIEHGIAPDVNTSEQDTLDCSGAGNCGGGWWAFANLVNAGSATELSYPYQIQQNVCRADASRVFHAVDWDYVGSSFGVPSVSAIKQALCEHGPLAVAVAATPLFQAYAGGVFNEQSSADINHGVTLIGWNDQEQAWLIKNSWGKVWGETGGFGTEKGFIRIAYGSNSIGTAAAWVDSSTAVEFETDASWRAIGPVGNLQGTPLTAVGGSWESTHPGWNSDPLFDDSNAAGWTSPIINKTKEPLRPELPFIWVNDPNGDGLAGSTPAYFRKVFTLNQAPKLGRLTVQADDDAQVYINGQLVLNDLSGRSELHVTDVTPYLKAGTNLIAVKAHDSFSIFEGLYLSLRVGAQEVANASVSFAPDRSSYKTVTDTVGCPASSVGKFNFNATLSNASSNLPLSDVFVELAELTNGNVLLADGGLMGTGDSFPLPAVGLYTDGALGRGESVVVPFSICLANKNPFRFFVNMLAVK